LKRLCEKYFKFIIQNKKPTFIKEFPERAIADANSRFPALNPSHLGCEDHLPPK
jgi:hypothetical protein